MTKVIEHKVAVTGYTRLTSSTNGNPRFKLHTLESGDWTTQSDSGCSYSVENDFRRATEAAPVAVTLDTTPAGRVFGWTLTDGK